MVMQCGGSVAKLTYTHNSWEISSLFTEYNHCCNMKGCTAADHVKMYYQETGALDDE